MVLIFTIIEDVTKFDTLALLSPYLTIRNRELVNENKAAQFYIQQNAFYNLKVFKDIRKEIIKYITYQKKKVTNFT